MTKPAYYPKLGAQLKYFYPTIASIFKTFKLIFSITPKDFSRWWRRLDSNQRTQREQIYSLPPLTTRPLLRNLEIARNFVVASEACQLNFNNLVI